MQHIDAPISDDIESYYKSLSADELIVLYKSGDLSEYLTQIVTDILQNRNIDTDKIDRILIRSEIRPPKEIFLDYVGVVGFLFGIIAPIVCALYETYVWLTTGHWPGYSARDLLHYLHIISDPQVNWYMYIEGWQQLTSLVNRVIEFVLNLSLILFLGLMGFVIFEFVDLLHTIINKKRNFKRD